MNKQTHVESDLVYGVFISKTQVQLDAFLNKPFSSRITKEDEDDDCIYDENEKLAKVLGIEYLCSHEFKKKYGNDYATSNIFIQKFGFSDSRGVWVGGYVMGIGRTFTNNCVQSESLNLQYMVHLTQDTQMNHKLKTFLKTLGFKYQEPTWLNLVRVF